MSETQVNPKDIKALILEGKCWQEIASSLDTTPEEAILALLKARISPERVPGRIRDVAHEIATLGSTIDEATKHLSLSRNVVSGIISRYIRFPLGNEIPPTTIKPVIVKPVKAEGEPASAESEEDKRYRLLLRRGDMKPGTPLERILAGKGTLCVNHPIAKSVLDNAPKLWVDEMEEEAAIER